MENRSFTLLSSRIPQHEPRSEIEKRERRASYCTFALTDALAFRVNVHVLRLFPPLEHAPDQMASRPLLTLRVIDVPVLNDADPVLPTFTLMPAGLDVMRSPLRPLAVTVSVAGVGGAPCGPTVSVVVRDVPP
jgi:hypothetical protein